jgi:hypothetical protein
MKKINLFRSAFILIIIGFISLNKGYAQDWQEYTWSSYKTKFKVPSNFRVTTSSGEEWSGTNDDIALTIYPRKGENLTQRAMDRALTNWANDQGVGNLTEIVDLDSKKLNGYWGVLIEGTKDNWPVALMLIVDPDYPDTSMYVWVSYREGLVDTVLQILYSFIPS